MKPSRSLPLMTLMLLCAAVLALPGCQSAGGSGALQARSFGAREVVFPAGFNHAVYGEVEGTMASIYLSDVAIEDMLEGRVERGQIIHIELLWLPRAGRTPLAPTASNISLRHVIIADGEFAVYGGAGFARPSGTIGKGRLSMNIVGASLRLLDKSDGWVDLLTPGELSGSITAVHDPAAMRRMSFAASQMVTNLLGRPRWVMHDPPRTNTRGGPLTAERLDL